MAAQLSWKRLKSGACIDRALRKFVHQAKLTLVRKQRHHRHLAMMTKVTRGGAANHRGRVTLGTQILAGRIVQRRVFRINHIFLTNIPHWFMANENKLLTTKNKRAEINDRYE